METQEENNTTQSNVTIVKRPKSTRQYNKKLSYKQRQFIKNYKETGNGVQSALKAGYGNGRYDVASSTASVLLKNPKVLAVLNDSIEQAEMVVKELMHSENEDIRLKAARETLDRTIGKAVQRSENLHVNITVESMLDKL